MPFGERFLRYWGAILARFVYRNRTEGLAHLPAGGFLLLPNHLTWVDAIVLQVACPRPIRFLVFEAFYKMRFLGPLLRAIGTLPISPKHAKDSIRIASEALAAGEIVCIFPEGELSRS